MGSMSLDNEHKTPVPPRAALAWWFDLGPDDHADPRLQKIWRMKPGDGRKISGRTKDSVTTDDVFGGQRMSFTMRLEGNDTIVTTGKGDGFTSKGWIKFAPDPMGTRITSHIESNFSGIASLVMLFLGGAFKKQLQEDFQVHNQIMEADWKKKPW